MNSNAFALKQIGALSQSEPWPLPRGRVLPRTLLGFTGVVGEQPPEWQVTMGSVPGPEGPPHT